MAPNIWLLRGPDKTRQSDDVSILTYSLFTGLGYFAQTPYHGFFALLLLQVCGEWSLEVALVMERSPQRLRPLLAGAIGEASNVGFVSWVGKMFLSRLIMSRGNEALDELAR